MKSWLIISLIVSAMAAAYMYWVYARFKVRIKKHLHEQEEKQWTDMQMSGSGSGMSEAEIDRLEQALGKKLPGWYKTFLLNYPDDLVELGAPYNTVSELSLPNNADRLIEISSYEDSPGNILIIGVDGLGNFYYHILDSGDEKIYLFDHESPVFLDEAETQIDWKNSYSELYEGLPELIANLRRQLEE